MSYSYLILYWIMPSMMVFMLCVQTCLYVDEDTFHQGAFENTMMWGTVVIMSVLYPTGIAFVCVIHIMHFCHTHPDNKLVKFLKRGSK